MSEIKFHPACAVWPSMSESELAELTADIVERGQLDPITLMPDGEILDGRCRWQACQRAGVEPRTVVYEGNDPIGFVLSRNRLRRHMSKGKLTLAVARLADLCANGSNQYKRTGKNLGFANSQTLSRADLAERSGLSSDQISKGVSVLTHGEPNVIQMVEYGAVGLDAASEVARALSRNEQKTMTPTEVKRKHREIVQTRARKSKTPARTGIIDPPYQPIRFPTREEMGMPPVGSPLEEYDAFYKKYGRTPLHPKTVKDMLNCEGETNGLVCSVVSLGNPDHPEIDKFFDSIDQLLAWKPKLDKTNGEETDFARQGRATMALLKKYLPVALARLLALDARMKDRIKVA